MSAPDLIQMREFGQNLVSHPVANGTIDCTERAGQMLVDAAAALKSAEATRRVLTALDARLRECMALGLTAAEAYDSFYQAETAAAVEGAAPVPAADPQVEALREALQLIAGTDPVDAALDPQRAVRVARAALAGAAPTAERGQ